MRQYQPSYYPPAIPRPESLPPEPVCSTGRDFPFEARSHAILRTITYSGFSRQSANTQLYRQLQKGDYETAFYWGGELMAAGHWEDVWDVAVYFISLHVYTGNVLLPGYLWSRRQTAHLICKKGGVEYRNKAEFRTLVAELLTVVIMAKKNPPLSLIKIRRDDELRMSILESKLEAEESYIHSVFKQTDPAELKVPVNELMHHLKNSRHNMMQSCYWVEWVLEFELLCRANKDPLVIAKRSAYDVPENTSSDVVWLLWDVFMYVCADMAQGEQKQSILQTLCLLFCAGYSRTRAKKRRPILYYAVAVLVADTLDELPLMPDGGVLWEYMQTQLYTTYQSIQDQPVYMSGTGESRQIEPDPFDDVFV